MFESVYTMLLKIESVFAEYSFSKEAILVLFGAVFGALLTAMINNSAMKAQSRFNMQYKILSEESENISKLHREIEELEIKISFTNMETKQFSEDISKIENQLFKLNERLRDKRKYVRKYMKATTVEKSACCVSEFGKIFRVYGDNGVLDLRLVEKLNGEKLENLRKLVKYIDQLNNEMTEAMEKLISPGLVSKFKRKCRKPIMYLEDCIAIYRVERKNYKKNKPLNK